MRRNTPRVRDGGSGHFPKDEAPTEVDRRIPAAMRLIASHSPVFSIIPPKISYVVERESIELDTGAQSSDQGRRSQIYDAAIRFLRSGTPPLDERPLTLNEMQQVAGALAARSSEILTFRELKRLAFEEIAALPGRARTA